MSGLSISGMNALAVAIATVAIYLAFIALIRVLGQRSLAAMSVPEVAGVVALGAVIGRTALLAVPSLGGGIVALTVLLCVQRVLRVSQRSRGFRTLLDRQPVLLARDGKCDDAAMRRAGVSEDDLRQRLRLAGISRWEQVGRVVLERNGQISVVRHDPECDEWLFADILEAPVPTAAAYAIRS
jgi:uncharacterized membrane protein YcaP (DUF421 family)